MHKCRNGGENGGENRDGSEDARGGVTLTSNQKPHQKDPTPQRDRRIIQRTRAHMQEARDRIGEEKGGAEKRKKLQER